VAAATFEEALDRLLVHEGGYSNHPSDPGGPTNFGITIHDYRKYVKSDATAADVRMMQVATAKAIYREKYWNVLRCDALPAGLDYAVFDYGVNSGVFRAAKVLQRLLSLNDDGRISDAVIAAARARPARELIAKLCDERLAFLKRLKTWPVFGRGWSRRVAEVKAASLAMSLPMAAGASRSAPAGPAPARAEVPVAKFARGTTTAIVVAGGTVAAQQAGSAGWSHAGIAAMLLATAVAAGLCWFAFQLWRKRRQEAA